VLGASTGSASYGDIKRGVQAADHSGWIKLDGRLKSSLTATQQAEATALGFGANLPNATDAFLVQNGASIGSVSGSNTKTIAQNNLPNVTLSGTTSSSGDHAHTNNSSSSNGGYGIVRTSNGGNNTITDADVSAGEPNILSSAIALTINATGAHTHTLTTSSINGGVAQQTLNITPKSLSVTTFIYLGN
jgi:hypothetical protein